MTQTVSDLNRISNFTGLSGSDQSYSSTDDSINGLRLAVAELGRQVEIEFDRIYDALRRVNTQAEIAASAAEAEAIAESLWEYRDGDLIPKDPDA